MNFLNDFFVNNPIGAFIVISAFIGVLGAFTIQRYIAFRNAITTFKNSFTSEISAVRNNKVILGTFTNNFADYEIAVDRLMDNLSRYHRRKLQKAWNNYCGKGNDLGMTAIQYIEATSVTFNNKEKEFKAFKKRFKKVHSYLDFII